MDDQDKSQVAATTAAEAIVGNADRLGLTWQLRPATIQSALTPSGSSAVTVVIDGDTSRVSATSMIGSTYPGQRVYVIIVPPGGVFIVGVVALPAFNSLDSQVFTGGTIAGSTGTEVAIASGSYTGRNEPNFNFAAGLVYQMTLVTGAFPSTATNSITSVRIRKGSGTISGTQYAYWQVPLNSAENGNVGSHTQIAWVKNAGAGSVSTKLSITNQRINGAATTSLFGDGNVPIILSVMSVGAIAQLPNLATVAVQV